MQSKDLDEVARLLKDLRDAKIALTKIPYAVRDGGLNPIRGFAVYTKNNMRFRMPISPKDMEALLVKTRDAIITKLKELGVEP